MTRPLIPAFTEEGLLYRWKCDYYPREPAVVPLRETLAATNLCLKCGDVSKTAIHSTSRFVPRSDSDDCPSG